ncbi:MAG TPA: permease prefix domain 1-containing protein [Dongiaceae bacterium]|nr:permease prefix domain 1-containing protein [Dongiaceae bacterium]
MKLLRNIWAQLRAVGQRGGAKRDIDEELLFHLEQQMAENLAAGMSPG